MQKKQNLRRKSDKEIAAAFGFYCEACSWFFATSEDHERLKRLAVPFHFSSEGPAYDAQTVYRDWGFSLADISVHIEISHRTTDMFVPPSVLLQ